MQVKSRDDKKKRCCYHGTLSDAAFFYYAKIMTWVDALLPLLGNFHIRIQRMMINEQRHNFPFHRCVF